VIGCKKSHRSDVKIHNLELTTFNDSVKLEFLNQILSDTSKTKLIFDKKELISNIPSLVPPILPIDINNPKKTISHANFISDTLKINDIEFVKNQMVENKQFDLSRISELGFNIIDIKAHSKQGISLDSIDKLAEKYYIENKIPKYSSILYISKPIFNKELNLAYIRIRHGSGGKTRMYEKLDERWNLKYEFGEWVE